MLVKTSELKGAALNWVVAKCEGYTDYCDVTEKIRTPHNNHGWVQLSDLNYSTDWSQGGPIIEREVIDVWSSGVKNWSAKDGYRATNGPTPLIAAMRCYVKSKFGEFVEIPEQLR